MIYDDATERSILHHHADRISENLAHCDVFQEATWFPFSLLDHEKAKEAFSFLARLPLLFSFLTGKKGPRWSLDTPGDLYPIKTPNGSIHVHSLSFLFLLFTLWRPVHVFLMTSTFRRGENNNKTFNSPLLRERLLWVLRCVSCWRGHCLWILCVLQMLWCLLEGFASIWLNPHVRQWWTQA